MIGVWYEGLVAQPPDYDPTRGWWRSKRWERFIDLHEPDRLVVAQVHRVRQSSPRKLALITFYPAEHLSRIEVQAKRARWPFAEVIAVDHTLLTDLVFTGQLERIYYRHGTLPMHSLISLGSAAAPADERASTWR